LSADAIEYLLIAFLTTTRTFLFSTNKIDCLFIVFSIVFILFLFSVFWLWFFELLQLLLNLFRLNDQKIVLEFYVLAISRTFCIWYCFCSFVISVAEIFYEVNICFCCVCYEQKISKDVYKDGYRQNSIQQKKFRIFIANYTSANNICKKTTRFYFRNYFSEELCMQKIFLRAAALKIVIYLSTLFLLQQNCLFLLQTIFIFLDLDILRNKARKFKNFKISRALIVSSVIVLQ